MEKKMWVSPVCEMTKFAANEYVAACGDEEKVYRFECDAGNGQFGSLYKEDNGSDGLQTGWFGGDTSLGSGASCGHVHNPSVDSDFFSGWFKPQGVSNSEATEVIIWHEAGGSYHATTNANIDSWIVLKS